MKYAMILITLLSFNSFASDFPSAEEQIKVLCKDHKTPGQCKRAAKKMLASAYRVNFAAMACTNDPRLPYCDDIFKDASDLDKWGHSSP
jgi:hypothetical protein